MKNDHYRPDWLNSDQLELLWPGSAGAAAWHQVRGGCDQAGVNTVTSPGDGILSSLHCHRVLVMEYSSHSSAGCSDPSQTLRLSGYFHAGDINEIMTAL